MTKEIKKGFIMYYDYRQHLALLKDEERGKLLMALLDYGENGSEPELEGAPLMAFSFIRAQMDRDTEKYVKTCEKRSQAGKQGGRPPKPKEEPEKQEKPKKANAFSEKQSKAKKGDTETDTDTDTETDTVTDTDTFTGIYPPSNPPRGKRGAKKKQDAEKLTAQEKRFAEFWDLYPKKVGKKAAHNAWMKLKPDTELFAHIMQAVRNAKKSEQWNRESGRFIPNPSTWINQGRWDDELTPVENVQKQPDERRTLNNGRRESSGGSGTLSGFTMAEE